MTERGAYLLCGNGGSFQDRRARSGRSTPRDNLLFRIKAHWERPRVKLSADHRCRERMNESSVTHEIEARDGEITALKELK